MGMIYYYGDTAVKKEDVKQKSIDGTLKEIIKSSSKTDENNLVITKGLDFTTKQMVSFTEIGINKPLSIVIQCAYSGDAPKKIFGRKKDIMITSCVKSFATFDAAPKAINLMKQKIENREYFILGADDKGCDVVYYTSALDVGKLKVSFQMVADNFNDKLVKKIGNLFKTANNLPIFAPLSSMLVAGSAISNLVGNIGKSLFETGPFMEDDLELTFNIAGAEISQAKQFLMYNDGDVDEFDDYKPGYYTDINNDKQPALVHKETNKKYKGRAPYILLSRDGALRHDLSNFAPKFASAALLEKYYGKKDDGEGQSFEILEQAIGLYNDLTYHNKAKELEDKIKDAEEGSVEFTEMSDLLQAYKKNIVSDQFKL